MNPFEGYRITSPFGWRSSPFGSGEEWHTGIDLVKSHRAPIYAFTDGQVIFAGMGQSGTGFGGYGIVVAIRDKNHCLQCYCHLDSISVSAGNVVSKGQEIGRQGSTGQSTGSHLHYEVRKRAQTSPPYGWEADRVNNCHEPTQYLIDYFGEDEEEMKLSDYEWKMVAATLNQFYENGVISDESWITKAENKELTLSELTFLNLIMLARK